MPRRPTEPDEFKEFHFPLAGMDLSKGFDNQPVRPLPNGMYTRTTPVGINVRAYEPGSSSARGGQRPGLSRYLAAQLGSVLQDLNLVTSIVPIARGTGGGFQPGPPAPVDSFLYVVGFTFIPISGLNFRGFNIITRLESNIPKARSATPINSLSILGPLNSPLGDYTSANAGYQLNITAVDQNGVAVALGGQLSNTIQLRMNSNGTITYLGTPVMEFDWVNRPGQTTTYTMTAVLWDNNNNPIAALDGSGNPTGGNVQVTFSQTVVA